MPHGARIYTSMRRWVGIVESVRTAAGDSVCCRAATVSRVRRRSAVASFHSALGDLYRLPAKR